MRARLIDLVRLNRLGVAVLIGAFAGAGLTVLQQSPRTRGGTELRSGLVASPASPGAPRHTTIPPAASVWRFDYVRTYPGDGVWRPVPMDQEYLDTQNLHSPSVNPERVTVPVAGIYQVNATANWQPNATARYRAARIRVLGPQRNGWTLIATGPPHGNVSEDVVQSGSTLYRLAAGDYVQLEVKQDSNVTIPVRGELSVVWIGPAQ